MQIALVAALAILSPPLAPSPPSGAQDFEANLLKIGTKAPAFSVNNPKGGKISLAQAMKGKKATLVNFWFYG